MKPSSTRYRKSSHGVRQNSSKYGFALVATMSLMVLLFLVALSMLSLSTITVRQGSKSAQAQAQANARLALMLAIGELQKEMGPDQRISANADILSLDEVGTQIPVVNPHWTGVWDSWIAGSLPDSVNDKYPSTVSHHQTIGAQPEDSMRPKYAQKNLHFRKWLVSLLDTDIDSKTPQNTPISLTLNGERMPNDSSTAVQLVGEGSLGSSATSADYVSARLISRMDKDASKVLGRYGWWVGDESQKARVMNDSYATQTTLTHAEKIFRSQAPASTGTKTISGMEKITDDTQLAALPSHSTLDLIDDVVDRPSRTNFHDVSIHSLGVLADVREGGLKRDLSTLLERPIDLSETGDPFMLYRFDTNGQERVPIQDLAAYYQLYDNDPNWVNQRRGGVAYDPSDSEDGIQIMVPDYGNAANKEKYLRQYTALYRNPVPIRVQFILAVGASPITQADRDYVTGKVADGHGHYTTPIRAEDTHKLRLGVMPVVTLWNPSNLPMVMEQGSRQIFKFNTPPIATKWKKFSSSGDYENGFMNLNFSMVGTDQGDGRATRSEPYLIQFKFADSEAIKFAPGEVKLFSLPSTANNSLLTDSGNDFGGVVNLLEPINEWNANGVFVTRQSARRNSSTSNSDYGPDAYRLGDHPNGRISLFFKATDQITVEIATEAVSPAARNISAMNEVLGGTFNFWLADRDYVSGNSGTLHFRNYQFISRFGGGTGVNQGPIANFNGQLMSQGFPNGTSPINFDTEDEAMLGSQIIAATENGEAKGFMMFSMMAGCESSSNGVGGYGGGRRTTTRPFLHGSTIAAPMIDRADDNAIYNYGWEWQVERINSIEETIQLVPGTGNAFYGGGYTSEAGVTHVVQQQIPTLPPISIASFSHAHLGGFSLANAPVTASSSDNLNWNNTIRFNTNTDERFRGAPEAGDFQQVTATGQGGLAPHVMQATGNSYAHPNIPSDKAYTTYDRHLNDDIGTQEVTFADHSYLANKALWDEFFFSSISPQPSGVKLYGSSTSSSAEDVAKQFFFDGGFLPNRRMEAYMAGLDKDGLSAMFQEKDQYTAGLADKIAKHLMVSGSFNINSTSVEAWKIVLSSLRGKPVTFLEQTRNYSTDEIKYKIRDTIPQADFTPIGPGMLTNAESTASSELSSDPNSPPKQWKSGRVISDDEILELAYAMVRQVKKRGPFLSLSEFVNRRLDSSDTENSLKGALQAALDDPDYPTKDLADADGKDGVAINASFRTPERSLDTEVTGIDFDNNGKGFQEAAEGPIAYGSTPYIDQADILRNFAAQLTPRGDTFVIRAYGDSLASDGSVRARAWCESVVQRAPDYVYSNDDNELGQSDLQSTTNKLFGRKFHIVNFRWLNPDEV